MDQIQINYKIKTLIIYLFFTICMISSMNIMGQEKLYPYTYKKAKMIFYAYKGGDIEIGRDKRFSFANPFKGNYAVVESEGKFGVINRNGDWVLEPKYSGMDIIEVGDTQVFTTITNKTSSTKFYKWQLMPEFSIGFGGGGSGPFIGTKSSTSTYRVFDTTGKQLLSDSCNGRYSYEHVQSEYCYFSYFDYSFFAQGEKIFISNNKKNELSVYHRQNERDLKRYKTFKDVQGLTNKGFLMKDKKTKKVYMYDFEGKQASKEPFEYKKAILSDPKSANGMPRVLSKALWVSQGVHYGVYGIESPLMKVSDAVVDKCKTLLLPLDKDGNNFWINYEGNDVGIISKDGVWVLHRPGLRFIKYYSDYSLTYRDSEAGKSYFRLGEEEYAFPVESTIWENVSDYQWKMKDREKDEKGNSIYYVYDVKQQKIVVPRGVYIASLGNGYYKTENKIYKDNGNYDLNYEVVDSNRTVITKKKYRNMSITSDPELVLATPQNGGDRRYVYVATGEEVGFEFN